MLVDASYLAGVSTSSTEVRRWHDFFASLGVLDFLYVHEVTETLTRQELVRRPFTASLSPLGLQPC